MPLNRRQRRTLATLADTLLPSIGQGDPPGGEVVPEALEALLEGSPEASAELGIALDLLEMGALPLHGRRFSSLGERSRQRYIEGWMRSRLAFRRKLYSGLREACMNAYYQSDVTWSFLEYGGPHIERTRAKGKQP